MRAEWSAECSNQDPVLVVPWYDPEKNVAFVDLRSNPYDFDRLPEAEQYPALMQALRALNAARSPVFTAKCDAWFLTFEQCELLRFDLDLPSSSGIGREVGFGSYIDLVWRERNIFASFHQQEQQVYRLTRLAAALDHPSAALECVIRPAFLDLTSPQEGFAVSLYVKALAADAAMSLKMWSDSLEAVVALLRSREFASS